MIHAAPNLMENVIQSSAQMLSLAVEMGTALIATCALNSMPIVKGALRQRAVFIVPVMELATTRLSMFLKEPFNHVWSQWITSLTEKSAA